jgi:beta-lactamase regulating signal transducer with metallopeptidase domain
MPVWVEVVLFNALSATVLAVLVALVAPRIRRPSIVHTLWLLVLLKLVAPPIFEVGVPGWERMQEHLRAQEASSLVSSVRSEATERQGTAAPPADRTVHGSFSQEPVSSEKSFSTASPGRSALILIPLVAVAGTVLVLTVTIVDLVRFRRRLRKAPDAPLALQARAQQLGRSMGIRRQPRIRIVDGRIPPSLWPGPGTCELLLPAELLRRLDDDERDALLAHELAHIQRRDHWLRPLELLIVAFYWWHPVAWWARRSLRAAEELACDALVIRRLGDRSRVYAESLLKTVEFLATHERAVPVLATGIAGTTRLKERIAMIMKKKSPDPLPIPQRSILYAAVLLTLLVSPAWVERASSAGGQPNPESAHQLKLMAMQEEEVRVQREMQRLEQDRLRVRLQLDEEMTQKQLETMRQEMETLAAAGKKSEAEEMRRHIDAMEQDLVLRRKELEGELTHTGKRLQIEHELQDVTMQMQKAEIAGDHERARELKQRTFELEQALRSLQLEALQADLERQRARLQQEQLELEKLKQ